MATPASPIPPRDPSADGTKQVELLISIAREQAIEATKDADAIEGKARSVAQMAAVFMAASLTATSAMLATRPNDAPRLPLGVVLAAVGLGAVALCAVLAMAWWVMRMHRPVDQQAVKADVLERLLHFAQDDNLRVPSYLLDRLISVAGSRRGVANDKAGRLQNIYISGYIALATSGAQVLLSMVVAFATR